MRRASDWELAHDPDYIEFIQERGFDVCFIEGGIVCFIEGRFAPVLEGEE